MTMQLSLQSPLDLALIEAARFVEAASFERALEVLDRALTLANERRRAEVYEQRASVRVWQSDLVGAIADFRAAATDAADGALAARCRRTLAYLERVITR